MARLINANLNEANLTGACLWETQRAGWSIRGIICESVYWDEEGEEKTCYSPGEFEKLYVEGTKIRLFYKNRIDYFEVVTLHALIQYLTDINPECSLRLVSISDAAGGILVDLALELPDNFSSEQAKDIKRELEAQGQKVIELGRKFTSEEERAYILGRYDELSLRYVEHLQLVEGRTEIHVQGGIEVSNKTFNVSGPTGAVGDNAHAHDITFNQIWNQLQGTIDLPKLADELSRLRQEMKNEAVEPEQDIAVSEIAKAEQSAKAGEGSKTVEHLKSAGKWAFDVATKIGTSLAAEALKKTLG
jgi:hypothetical protein